MAAFLAAGTTATQSADFTLAAGDTATLFAVDANGTDGIPIDTTIEIQIKSSFNEYFTIGVLNYGNPILVLDAVGTFRLNRRASNAAVGAEKN